MFSLLCIAEIAAKNSHKKNLFKNPGKLKKPKIDVLTNDNIISGYVKEREKVKKLEEDGNTPQSAFLGPTLWDKTLSYDGDSFQLEYMDLEEFLSENGIPSSPAQHDQNLHHHQHQQQQQQQQQQQASMPQGPISVMDLSSQAITSIHTGMVPQNCLHSPGRPGTDSVPQWHFFPISPQIRKWPSGKMLNWIRWQYL